MLTPEAFVDHLPIAAAGPVRRALASSPELLATLHDCHDAYLTMAALDFDPREQVEQAIKAAGTDPNKTTWFYFFASAIMRMSRRQVPAEQMSRYWDAVTAVEELANNRDMLPPWLGGCCSRSRDDWKTLQIKLKGYAALSQLASMLYQYSLLNDESFNGAQLLHLVQPIMYYKLKPLDDLSIEIGVLLHRLHEAGVAGVTAADVYSALAAASEQM